MAFEDAQRVSRAPTGPGCSTQFEKYYKVVLCELSQLSFPHCFTQPRYLIFDPTCQKMTDTHIVGKGVHAHEPSTVQSNLMQDVSPSSNQTHPAGMVVLVVMLARSGVEDEISQMLRAWVDVLHHLEQWSD